MISAVDNIIIFGMSGTTSGAYCQQWTAIHGATCICDAVFILQFGIYAAGTISEYIILKIFLLVMELQEKISL